MLIYNCLLSRRLTCSNNSKIIRYIYIRVYVSMEDFFTWNLIEVYIFFCHFFFLKSETNAKLIDPNF